MTTYTTIRNKIKAKLEAIDKIQEVNDYPKQKFAGFPSANILPTRQESGYMTTIHNGRSYTFAVNLYYDVEHSGIEEALNALFDLVDDVLDNFDKDPQLAGISLPVGYTMVTVTPTNVVWGQVPDTHLISATINVETKVEFNINS